MYYKYMRLCNVSELYRFIGHDVINQRQRLILDKSFDRDSLAALLIFVSLPSPRTSGVGSAGHCSKLEERSAKVREDLTLISFAGWQVRKDIALEFTDGMSGILGPWCTYCRACCPLLGFYTLTSVAVARVYGRVYINVPKCVFFPTECSMHLPAGVTAVVYLAAEYTLEFWCIPGVHALHWKARGTSLLRGCAPPSLLHSSPCSDHRAPHGHSWTGQGGGWGSPHTKRGDPEPPHWAPYGSSPVQWLQAGGPTIQEVLRPLWELKQVAGGGSGLPEGVGPGSSLLHSGHLLLLPALGCGKPSPGEWGTLYILEIMI